VGNDLPCGAFSIGYGYHAMMDIAMSKKLPVNGSLESSIGSMKGTMEILGDIVAPIDVKWDADSEVSCSFWAPTPGCGPNSA
jgi:hypothetical protein